MCMPRTLQYPYVYTKEYEESLRTADMSMTTVSPSFELKPETLAAYLTPIPNQQVL